MRYIKVVLLFACIFQSCQKDSTCIAHYTFTSKELNLIPYIGNETIILEDSLHSTRTFNCNNPEWSDQGMETLNIGEGSSYFYSIDRKSAIFTSNWTEKSLEIFLTINVENFDFDNSSQNVIIKKNFYITIPNLLTPGPIYYTEFHRKIENENLVLENTDIFYDSVIIDSVQYFNVYKLSGSYKKCEKKIDSDTYPEVIYYSATNGLISVRMTDGHSWYIKN